MKLPAARSRRSLILLLGLVSGLSTFGMASVVPSLPNLAQSFDRAYGDIQFVVSVYLLGLALGQPFQGMLSDRYGRRPVLLTGFAIFFLGSLGAALAPSFALLVGCRFLQAVGASVATVISRAIVRDTHEPHEAAVTLSFVSMVMGIAPIVAPLAGGLVMARFEWHALFAMHAVIAFGLWLWIFASLRESRPPDTRAGNVREFFADVGVLVADRRFMGHALTYAFMSGSSFVFVTIGAALFERLYQIPPAQFGLLWASLAVAFMAGAYFAARLTRRYRSERVLLGGVRLNLISGFLFVAAAAWSAAPLLAYCAVLSLSMFAFGMASPLSLAGAVADRPQIAGVASGLSSSIAMLIATVFAAVTGSVFNGEALSVAWLMPVTCLGAWIAVHRALPRHASKHSS
jgi:DHA1 family bicyclomycin/chloramphenicol resistance-like MFS transporter